jgi:hypothetical protein
MTWCIQMAGILKSVTCAIEVHLPNVDAPPHGKHRDIVLREKNNNGHILQRQNNLKYKLQHTFPLSPCW